MKISYAKKIEVIRAMCENSRLVAASLKELGEENSRLYQSALDEITNLSLVLNILESDEDAKDYADIYNVEI